MTGAHPAPGPTRPDGSPLRVLVVDDDVNIAELLARALRYEGWQVSMAHTGSRAVAAAKDDRPDAVVLDVMLPDFDGGEVLRRMRGHHPDVPALFLTARDAVEDRVAGITAAARTRWRSAGSRRPRGRPRGCPRRGGGRPR